MRLVRGAEFSCVSPTGRDGAPRCSVHLLGYLFDPAHPAIVAEQARLRDERVVRLRADDREDGRRRLPGRRRVGVRARCPQGASAGRPHLARALVAAGVVESVNEAFATLLYNGSPYYVPKADTPVERAIAMVRAAGGVAVFAHPLARRRGRVVEPSRDRGAGDRRASPASRSTTPTTRPEDRELLRGLAAEHGPRHHRVQRLPRHEQDHPDRGRAHRPRRVRGAGRPDVGGATC